MTEARRSVVVHGHFYQPPREDPWTGTVPDEPSAAPFHDWNRRVHDECYRAVVAARRLDDDGRISAVVNALEWISWDAGPTLLSWMAREAPETYEAFLDADARSLARLGHGNALAAPYHHVILPLAPRRDKVTEVRWGIEDFRRRFGREPEGMWLPEAAVDVETLEVLAAEGIRFTVLGPTQVEKAPPRGMPGRVRLPSGADIAIFVYDGGLSHDVAFGTLLRDAHAWAVRMVEEDGPDRRLSSLATDGETFGHHHRWGDMALAAAVLEVRERADARLENFASFLQRNPPETEVKVTSPSSWSCAHGVERWRANCGCRMDTTKPPHQEWRSVLRDALDELARDLHAVFASEGGRLFSGPWAARDAYGAVFDRGAPARRRFVEQHAAGPLSAAEARRAIELLEMERDTLRMFTSCGWFFDDLAGIEPLQVLRYAAHAIELAGDSGGRLERQLVSRLAEARSADRTARNGARLWETRVRLDARPPGGSAAPTASDTAAADPVLVQGLTDAVLRFVREPGDDRAREVERRTAELQAHGVPVPFEAQTILGRALADVAAAAPAATHEVAERLGFGPAATEEPAPRSGSPVGYVFGLHLHQPVGNFDEVFRSHADDVYLPLLRRIAERGSLPVSLHVSGPLLEWLEAHAHPLLDLVGHLAAEGSVELLLAGFYEPVLPVLSRPDRLEQIGWMRDWLRSRFGVVATGLWLTERVWEPGLAEDLAMAGVRYAMVDDRHFLVAGHDRRHLHRPWTTEAGGRKLTLLPIDERLRYLVPFRPPEELAWYLRSLQARDMPLAVLADDGEKFGGWPGTADWVWQQGWLERYLDTLDALVSKDLVRLLTPTQALERVRSGGLTYLPSASYREMEGWSLPAAAAHRLERAEQLVARSDGDPAMSDLLRGGHWRNFLSRYRESNRMHKKAAVLSTLCRERSDPPDARRAIGRAQCNDPYWHGVFGGLYLRHLRAAIWANLAEAEEILRRGEPLRAEVLDLDADGRDEVWVHSPAFSALVAPARGGAVEELTSFRHRANLADVLTRRRESYHRAEPAEPAHSADAGGGGMASIHALEEGLRFLDLPPFDREERAILVDRMLAGDVTVAAYERVEYEALASWAEASMSYVVEESPEAVVLRMSTRSPASLDKEITLFADGSLGVTWRWDPAGFPPDARFAPELSVSVEAEPGLTIEMDPPPEETWRYEIRTVSKSESGSETSVQGVAVTPFWPVGLGEARLSFRWS